VFLKRLSRKEKYIYFQKEAFGTGIREQLSTLSAFCINKRGIYMARQREEAYVVVPIGAEADAPPRCVVADCPAPVVAEVHDGDYSAALEMFRGIRRKAVRARRAGDERFFVCRRHLDGDRRMKGLSWQWLMF
jgi:hypothetical protein